MNSTYIPVRRNKSIIDKVMNNVGLKEFLITTLILLVAYSPNLILPFCGLLKVPSKYFMVGGRVATFIIGLFLIVTTRISFTKIKVPILLLLIFWTFYSYRLVTDVSFLHIPLGSGKRGALDIYSIFYGNGIIPCLAIILNRKLIKIEYSIKYHFYFLLFVNFLVLFQMYTRYGGFSVEMLMDRNMVSYEGYGGKTFHLLNPISLSIGGSSLGILSLFQFFYIKKFKRPLWLTLIGLGIGVSTLLLGGSRGPTLVFFLCLFLLTFLYLYDSFIKRGKVLEKIYSGIFLVGFTGVLIPMILLNIEKLKNTFVIVKRLDRFFNNTIQDKGDRRLDLITDAWNDFLNHPLFGYHYVESYSNFYPHNLFVEVFMATGIFGSTIFYTAFGYLLFYIGKNILSRDVFPISVSLIAIIFILGQFTSGCLFFGVNFWIYSTFILCLPQKSRNQPRLVPNNVS